MLILPWITASGAYNMSRKPTEEISLESALAELNTLIAKMEQGSLSLEESLTCFERGITLTKHCQKILTAAEQKVQILMKNSGQETLTPYQPAKNDDE